MSGVEIDFSSPDERRHALAECRRIRRILEAEVERLRAQLAECKEQFSAVTGQCSMHLDTIQEQREEIERLKGAQV